MTVRFSKSTFKTLPGDGINSEDSYSASSHPSFESPKLPDNDLNRRGSWGDKVAVQVDESLYYTLGGKKYLISEPLDKEQINYSR